MNRNQLLTGAAWRRSCFPKGTTMESPEMAGIPHSVTSANAAGWLIDALHAERVSADRERLTSLLLAADVPRPRMAS